MVNSKKKGSQTELRLAKLLRSHGINAYRDNRSGGGDREKGDLVNDIDITLEVKDQKRIDLMNWWKQVEDAASKHGNSPALFIHPYGWPQDGFLVVQHIEDWFESVKNQQGEVEVQQTLTYQQKRSLEKLKDSIREVIKEFPVE